MGLSNGATSFFNPFVNMFNFGTLERHPKLKFCLAESAIGWIPFVVQEMDYRYKRQFERQKVRRDSAESRCRARSSNGKSGRLFKPTWSDCT